MGVNRESEISRREFLKKASALAGGAVVPDWLTKLPQKPQELDSVDSEWEQFDIGDQVFGVAKGPIPVYTQPDKHSPTLPNIVLNTYPPESQEILYSPRHRMEKETTLRLKKITPEWAQILKQQDVYTPFLYPDSQGRQRDEAFVQVKDFSPIPQLESVNILPNTQPEDKEIVIVRYPSPQLLLVEQHQIVARIPVILGAGKTPTPNGDFPIEIARLFVHMMKSLNEGFVGVGYNLQVVDTSWGVVYMHNAPWWIWPNIKKGRYGSHGCINLPDIRWHNASIHGENVSMARFVFQWAKTNLPDYDQKKVEYVQIRPTDPKYKQHLSVHIMNAIDAAKWSKRANPKWGWESITEQFKGLEDLEWIIPHIP
jgi:hypothetical protein